MCASHPPFDIVAGPGSQELPRVSLVHPILGYSIDTIQPAKQLQAAKHSSWDLPNPAKQLSSVWSKHVVLANVQDLSGIVSSLMNLGRTTPEATLKARSDSRQKLTSDRHRQ